MPSPATDPVAIIGASGALGFGACPAARRGTGVPIAIGSRDAARAREAAERALGVVPDGSFSGHDNAAPCVRRAGVILSVPFRNHSETLTNLKDALVPGQLLIDATVPLAAAVSGKATRMLGVWQGSAAAAGAGDGARGRARRLGAAHGQRRVAHRSRASARTGRAACAATRARTSARRRC